MFIQMPVKNNEVSYVRQKGRVAITMSRKTRWKIGPSAQAEESDVSLKD